MSRDSAAASGPHRVLVVEDDPKIRANLLFQLRSAGYEADAVGSAEEGLPRLTGDAAAGPGSAQGAPDLLLLDIRLPGESGLDLVRRLAAEERLPATVVVSGEASISETVEALKLGVHDFIEKPFGPERLRQSIRNALENASLRREVASLRARLDAGSEILGRSPAIARLRERIARAAPTDGRILIRGESGTGKELVANALHRGSRRAGGPFVKINCAAIPPHLVEDELFGHVRGAFTDARDAKPGLFETADGGTLFLDEIGDMDVALQARLLRVLEDGRVRRIGDTRDREVDVRVLVATHRDLEEAVAEGAFREDLYFRLAHLPIEVPPLRDRDGDVRLLFAHFLERFAARHHRPLPAVEREVMERVETYRWPGNVRELRNLAERLVVFGGDPVTEEQLPSSFFALGEAPETGLLQLGATGLLPLRELRRRCEKEYVESVLQRTGWNVAAAARILEVQRTYLHEKLGALGLERPAPARTADAPAAAEG